MSHSPGNYWVQCLTLLNISPSVCSSVCVDSSQVKEMCATSFKPNSFKVWKYFRKSANESVWICFIIYLFYKVYFAYQKSVSFANKSTRHWLMKLENVVFRCGSWLSCHDTRYTILDHARGFETRHGPLCLYMDQWLHLTKCNDYLSICLSLDSHQSRLLKTYSCCLVLEHLIHQAHSVLSRCSKHLFYLQSFHSLLLFCSRVSVGWQFSLALSAAGSKISKCNSLTFFFIFPRAQEELVSLLACCLRTERSLSLNCAQVICE